MQTQSVNRPLLTTHQTKCTVTVGYDVHVLIQWSYICFTTTSLDTFDTCLLLRLCWDLCTKLLLLLVESCCSNNCFWACVQTPTVTLLYKTLNMCLAARIIGCRFRRLIGCLTFSGAPGLSWLKCRWQLGTVQKLLMFVYQSAGGPQHDHYLCCIGPP